MNKRRMRMITIVVEILFIDILILFFSTLLRPSDPLFHTSSLNPYLAFALFIAIYYGKVPGLLTLLFSWILFLLPLGEVKISLPTIALTGAPRASFSLLFVYLMGMVHNRFSGQVEMYRKGVLKALKRKSSLEKENRVLKDVNRELEERVLRQHESVTSLYTQIKTLHTQNLQETFQTLLDLVVKYSWARKASIWCFDKDTMSLVLMTQRGWDEQECEEVSIPIEGSIEGWCFRNKLIFSVRMLLQYENLTRMDRKRNIYTFPITFAGHSWGILNIEELPFVKYNIYVEKLLSILVDLASPEIERAVEYETMMESQIENNGTGLPGEEQYRVKIERALEKNEGGFSLILLEWINYSVLVEEYGEEEVLTLLEELLNALNELSGNKVDAYLFDEENRFAFFYPDIDYDGVSLFCLESLGVINSQRWKIGTQAVLLDLILGYSSYSPSGRIISLDPKKGVSGLLGTASKLLEMQKI